MAQDFITLTDAMTWLGITDQTQESLLQTAIAASTSTIVDYLGWDPNLRQATELQDGNGAHEIAVNRKNISAIGSISFVRSDGSLYAVDTSTAYCTTYTIGLRNQRFPRGRRNIQVTYTAGYSPAPAAIAAAQRMHVKALFVAKDVDQHVTAEAYSDVIEAAFWASGPGSIPPQAIAFLSSHRIVDVPGTEISCAPVVAAPPPDVTTIYTTSGAINPTDTLAVLNSAGAALTMTLASGQQDQWRLTVKRFSFANPVSVTAVIDGSTQTLNLSNPVILESVDLVWNTLLNSWVMT